jgi:hypothetical protein
MIERVVEVDIQKQRREAAALPTSPPGATSDDDPHQLHEIRV